MKRNPTPEYRGVRTRVAKVAQADSRSHPRIGVKPESFGLTIFLNANAARKTKREVLRTAEAIKQAGCRDVLIISTPEYIRFVVTIKLPKAR